MASSKELTPRQMAFVGAYVRGAPAVRAALEAGYSEHSTRDLLANPHIKGAIDAARTQLQATTGYGLEQAVAEIDQAIAEARQDKLPNRNSIIKGLELKSKIHGLIQDRLKIEDCRDIRIDLVQAHARAGLITRERVLEQLEYLCAHGEITMQDIERATRCLPIDVEFVTVPAPDPFSV